MNVHKITQVLGEQSVLYTGTLMFSHDMAWHCMKNVGKCVP